MSKFNSPKEPNREVLKESNLIPKKEQPKLINSSALNSIDELICYIGIVKAKYFSDKEGMSLPSSTKMIIFARLTAIQEGLFDIIPCLTKKADQRNKFPNFDQRIKEFELVIKDKDRKEFIIPGTTPAEAELHYCRALTLRLERQIPLCKNLTIGIIPDENVSAYLNKLAEYFVNLSIHILELEMKTPLKR